MKPKKILITGASNGFGKLTAIELAKRGHWVLAGLRGGESRLRGIVQESGKDREFLTRAMEQGRLRACDLHLDQPESFNSIDPILKEWGGELDVLINNAGFGLLGPVHLTGQKELRNVFEVNFFGPVALSQKVMPALEKTRGRIVNLSSLVGRISMPFYGSYSASKAALEAASEAMAHELSPKGISVCLVEPGGFKTGFGTAYQRPELTRTPGNPGHEQMNLFNRKIFEQTAALQGNPARVAKLLVRLSEKRSVRLRYVIGPDARALMLVSRLIPQRLLRGIFRLAFRDVLVIQN
jgi:short-subunit dehydrogenase